MPFQREPIAAAAAALASKNIYLGTSSWKYPGWIGQLYTGDRYLYRGKIAKTRFERNCLAEYAEVFKSVCVDAGYYRFPNEKYLTNLAEQVPGDFKFAFKVTDDITIKKFTRLARFGDKAGKENEHFLDAELFEKAFLRPCEAIRDQVGLLIFEFSRFYPGQFERGRDFVERLDSFLGALPAGWQYGIEIRNKNFLESGYFEVLSKHGVTHVYNNWTAMPSIGEQLDLEGSMTTDFAGVRFLLKPGRKYQEAVDAFSPYEKTAEKNDEARSAGARLLTTLLKREGKRPSFLFVNNRLEGNALLTIQAFLETAGLLEPAAEGDAPPLP